MKLTDSLTSIKGIGPRKAEALGKLGLFSLGELLYYFPRGHKDYSRHTYIMAARHGDDVALDVTAMAAPRLARIRKGMDITTARAYDQSGEITLTWYNQPYRANALREGQRVTACGRVDRSRGVKQVNPALYEGPPGILPVYPLGKGVSQKLLRDAVSAALAGCAGQIEETLPEDMLSAYGLMGLGEALANLHYPRDEEALAAASRRLAFEDVLLFRLMLLMMQRTMPVRGRELRLDGVKERFLSMLPFAPTGAQRRAMEDILRDLSSPCLMNRLLQGDVGSGKTAVAMMAMYAAMENGLQAVLMAPTEILAAQHYGALCRTFGGDKVAFLKGGMKKAERQAALQAIASGEAKAIVGTHALFQEGVEFQALGMVITDEQHRFGVKQRAAISAKGERADVLIMSATPIPRTLALMLYGDLSVSSLDELPPGRKPVMTRIVPEHRREDMYGFIERQVKAGRQAYVVCPLVENSDALDSVQSAVELYEELKQRLSVSVGLLHGQLSPARKERAAEAFRRGETGVLVATTVIEVGVDVPNATVMAVENADRFGLAQLHQLRGRVGRGGEKSYCFLLSGSDSEAAMERLSTLVKTGDGFEIAEKDLAMRGPGDFLGKRQHGLAEFAAAGLAANIEVLHQAMEAADRIAGRGLGPGASPIVERAREKLRLLDGEIAPN